MCSTNLLSISNKQQFCVCVCVQSMDFPSTQQKHTQDQSLHSWTLIGRLLTTADLLFIRIKVDRKGIHMLRFYLTFNPWGYTLMVRMAILFSFWSGSANIGEISTWHTAGICHSIKLHESIVCQLLWWQILAWRLCSSQPWICLGEKWFGNTVQQGFICHH